MDEKNLGAEEDFLAGVLGETDNELNPEALNDDLFGTIEKVAEEKEEKFEKPVSYRKDEKLQRYIDKQVEKRIKDFKPSAQEAFKQEVSQSGDPELVSAFSAIIGNDTPEKVAALAALEKSLKGVDERATKKAIEQLQKVQQEQKDKEQQELKEAEDELEEGFEEIETQFGVDLTSGSERANRLQNAYKSFLDSIAPKSGYQEYPDFKKTFELFKNSVVKRSNATAKTLASRGMERTSQVKQPEASFIKKDNNESLWSKIERLNN